MMRTSPCYAELHCISNFTFLRGASHPEELVQRALELGYQALAITDECSLSGVVRAHIAARDTGLRLIVGSEFRLLDATRLLLLAPDRQAYGDLCQLITRGRRNARKGSYRLERTDVAECAASCLALWLPSPQESPDIWPEQIRWLAEVFPGRSWIAAELLSGPHDRHYLQALQALSVRGGLPLVAAGDVHMHSRSRRPLQDALTAIRLGCEVQHAGQALYPNGERHLRSRDRLGRIYPGALLAETLKIAESCNFSLDSLRYEYPEELVPGKISATQHLRNLVRQGEKRRWPRGTPEKVGRLLHHELALIHELGYEHYFLTVHDIVRFARDRNILCQGRGSAANSAVCFALGITEVDPSRMEVLFERFISRERNEPPDIDVDFENHRREEILQYLYDKYGRERASLTATVITYRTRSAVRDLGKVLGFSETHLEQLAKSARWWRKGGLPEQSLKDAGLRPDSPRVRQLAVLVDSLIGFPRHLSQHVGGMVISRGLLSRLVPVENAAMAERTVIQWDKDDLDALGLLKVDCLALGMLSAIQRSLETLSARMGRKFTMADIPAEDPRVYEMMRRAETVGVFQIESRAQMSMLPRLKPACFYDLVIEIAIVRPGPIQGGMVHPYLRRRRGEEPVEYPSPEVREVLERTLGVPLFQEQVIQLAMVAGGFNAGEADRLRRAMGAWRRTGQLHQFEEKLLTGMQQRGYSEAYARRIFAQLRGFGEYGFPESHSASFAMLAYVSAWLKCHHPAVFTCALLNSQPMGFYGPSQLVQEARRQGVRILPADVSHSDWDCTIESPPGNPGVSPRQGQAALRLGLRMIKGLSQKAAQRLLAERRRGRFETVPEMISRCDLSQRDWRPLAAAGALQTLAGHRYQAQWQVGLLDKTARRGKQTELTLPIREPYYRMTPPTEGADLLADYRYLGLTLGRHPLAALRPLLQRRGLITQARHLRALAHGSPTRVVGIVIGRQRPGTASGVVFITLEDETGSLNVVVWGSTAQAQHRALLQARLLEVAGTLERDGEVCHLIAGRLTDRSEWLGGLLTRSRDFH